MTIDTWIGLAMAQRASDIHLRSGAPPMMRVDGDLHTLTPQSLAQEKQLAEQILNRVENVRSVVNELAVAPNSSLSERSNDALISGKVKASMIDSRDVFASAFKVVTERGTVYLMGRVTQREATRAVEIARGVSGVQKIIRVFEIITEEELKTLQPPPASEPAAAAPASKP